MENNIRFRNHFSRALPNLKGILWTVLATCVGIFAREDMEAAITVAVVWVILVAVLGYQVIIWAKTWITIGEQSIVIECNTFFSRKKNTIGIKNISNVNLEQSLVAMLLGTCTLKLDTNSLSTAETTDVTIVLKKDKAEELRAWLMRQISKEEVKFEEVQEEKREVPDRVRISGKSILLHGVLSSRFLYTIFIPLYLVFEIVTQLDGNDFEQMVEDVGNFASQTIGLGLLIVVFLAIWCVLVMGFAILRTVIKYWDFQIERKDKKLFLEYGLTKKINYSIPIDKIQAIVIKQSFWARLFKYYMVEVVNVGMNDDEKEAQAFLLPYDKMESLQEKIQMLLPEFAPYLELKAERQPKSVWVADLWSTFIWILVFGVVIFAVAEFAPTYTMVSVIGVLVICLWMFAMKVAGYLTRGTYFGEKVMLAVNGAFARKFVYIKYENIQYITLKQNFLAKRFGIQKGTGLLLASSTNQAQEIPYFREEEIERYLNHI